VWPQAAAQGADGGDGALWSGEVRRDLRGSPQGTIRAKKLRRGMNKAGVLSQDMQGIAKGSKKSGRKRWPVNTNRRTNGSGKWIL
jgi:hypothetical protein